MKNDIAQVGIIIVAYNSSKWLEKMLPTLLEQNYPNKRICLIDNNSSDRSVETFLEKVKDLKKSEYKIIKNKENIGFSRAVNMGIQELQTPYIMLANPDIVFDKSYISQLAKIMDSMPNIGAVTGKILWLDNGKKTKIIDSTGLLKLPSQRVIDRGQGEEDHMQFDSRKKVFGVSGCAPMYRYSALKEIEEDNKIFDEDMFMYKEDIDISWRLNKKGYINYYYPKAKCWHARGSGIASSLLKNRKEQSSFTKVHSLKNHYRLLRKNLGMFELIRYMPPILINEMLKWSYMAIYERDIIKELIKRRD